jgi:uncharacterized repeat protein (TIGR01451 family)
MGAGEVAYTITVSNQSTADTPLESIRDVLPAGAAYRVGSASLGGVALGDPNQAGSTLQWNGPFTVPASVGGVPGTAALTYTAALPAGVGTYVNTAIGLVGSTAIDTTLEPTDDRPATGAVFVNADPVAVSDIVATPQATPLAITVLDNDRTADLDIDGPDPRALSVTGYTQPDQGSVTFAGDEATYAPPADFQGRTSFTYTITDGLGGTASTTVIVNVGPGATDDRYTLGRASVTNPLDVLVNDICLGCTLSIESGPRRPPWPSTAAASTSPPIRASPMARSPTVSCTA